MEEVSGVGSPVNQPDWYFTLQDGKAKGPQGEAEIKEAIAKGNLSPFDLIYKEGAEKWQPIYQRQEFSKLFKQNIKANFLDSWVVLTKRPGEKGVAYIQRGPFSTDQVKDLLAQGEVQYRDFIWQEGRDKWSRISTLEIFNPPPVGYQSPVMPQDVDIDEVSGEEALSHVLRQQAKVEVLEESAPPEAVAVDLTKVPKGSSVAVRKIPRTPHQPTTTKALRGTLQVKERNRKAKSKSKFKINIKTGFRFLPVAIILFVVGVAAALWHQRVELLTQVGLERFVPKVASSPALEKDADGKKPTIGRAEVVSKDEVAKEVAKSPPPPEPPKPELPRIPPTRLSMKFEGGADPAIEFSTDASHHFSINLKVVGEAGMVLDAVSVYKVLRVRRSPDSKFRLSLSRLSLGEGVYSAEAELENFSDQIRFRLGANDASFKKKIERHKKLISLPFQRERRRLLRATSELVKLAEAIDSRRGKGGSTDQFKAFVSEHFQGINVENPRSLVQPQLWLRLSDGVKELRRMASGGMSSKESQALLNNIRLLSKDAKSLSLF